MIYRPHHRDEETTPPATVKGWIEKAAASADPPATLRAQLRKQLTDEMNNIVAAYQKDASASVELRKKIDKGLKIVEQSNIDIYGLAGLDRGEVKGATDVAADAGPTSDIFFGPNKRRSDNPNFIDDEGRFEPYGSLPKEVGNFFEKDHLVEKSWPLYAQGLKLGDEPIRDTILNAEPKGKKRPDDDTLDKRKGSLFQTKVFPKAAAPQVFEYDAEQGKAILVYRPIHRAATAGNTAAKSTADLLPDGHDTKYATAAKAFMQTDDDTKREEFREEVRKAIRPQVRKQVLAATDSHTGEVAGEYAAELGNVQKDNSDEKSKQAAAALMHKITSRVRDSLRSARTYTETMFPAA